MKNLVKIVFFVVMGCFAIALGVPSQHSEDRWAPKAEPRGAQEICVLGNVGKPSIVPFEVTTTLAEAIERAGGALSGLKANRANIVRRGQNGQVQVIQVRNLSKTGPSLQANDIIDIFPKQRKLRTNASTSSPCGVWYMLFKRTL
jgi:protein involved in polysaccharide export with SLBB domain